MQNAAELFCWTRVSAGLHTWVWKWPVYKWWSQLFNPGLVPQKETERDRGREGCIRDVFIFTPCPLWKGDLILWYYGYACLTLLSSSQHFTSWQSSSVYNVLNDSSLVQHKLFSEVFFFSKQIADSKVADSSVSLKFTRKRKTLHARTQVTAVNAENDLCWAGIFSHGTNGLFNSTYHKASINPAGLYI